MLKLTQTHKIAISVLAIFMVSLSIMLFLLSGSNQNLGHVQANVGHSSANSHGEGEAVAEDAAANLLNTYKSYFKDPGDMVFSTDAGGKFKYVSADFCELIGKECSLLSGELFFDYIHSEDLADLASKHSKIVKEGKDIDGVGPYRLKYKNADKYSLIIFNVHTLLDDEDQIAEIVFSVRDITKQVDEMHKFLPVKTETDPKSSEITPAPEDTDKEEPDDEGRPGDTRFMVEKISFNMHLLRDLF